MSWDWFRKIFIGVPPVNATEKPSPSDIVPATNIRRVGDTIVIDLKGLAIPFTKSPKDWSPFIADTKSMLPVAGYGHNMLYLAGADPDEQRIMLDWLWEQPLEGLKPKGNIAIYRIPNIAYYAHRIVGKGEDAQGRYYTFRADNPGSVNDPFRVREHEIEYVSIGVVY